MEIRISIVLISFVISFLHAGCAVTSIRSGISPSFTKGLAAIDQKNFAEATYHFAELAKEGDPGSMNNLGVSLLMVNRNDEALYWLKKASRYGDVNAKLTLKAMGETVPPSDLVGQHPTQLQQKIANEIIVTTLLGITAGITTYYATQSIPYRYNYPLNKVPLYQTNSFSPESINSIPVSSRGSDGSETLRMAPDGTYVVGTPRMAPDGSFVGGTPRMAPDGSFVGGTPRMAPDGSYVGGTPRMAPDGSYVGGTPRMAPDGSWVGVEP